MINILGSKIVVDRVLGGELRRHLQHVLAVHRHPGGAVGLLQMSAGGEGRAPVEDADVVEAEETSFEEIPSLSVFPVHPPGEVGDQLVEGPFQKGDIPFPRNLFWV